MAKKCFICGEPATSVDHIPPRSFFPKTKDMPSGVAEARKNLITVPACRDHNELYAKDDEVASYVILLTSKANSLGVRQFKQKAMRAISRSKGLIAAIFKKIEVYKLPDGTEMPTVQFDADRVSRVMERIARGLFYHEFGKPWDCSLSLLADGPVMPDLSPNPFQEVIEQLSVRFRHSERKGSSPTVFWYEWSMGEEGDCSHILRMCFYEGLQYYAVHEANQ
ncbi:HNH endonuclease [Candidatus Bipolaricaulota bacterium]